VLGLLSRELPGGKVNLNMLIIELFTGAVFLVFPYEPCVQVTMVSIDVQCCSVPII
jgi:hypothetical protein